MFPASFISLKKILYSGDPDCNAPYGMARTQLAYRTGTTADAIEAAGNSTDG